MEKFQIFINATNFFLSKFQINSYEVSFKCDPAGNFRAQLSAHHPGRMAEFSFNPESEFKNDDEIYKSAFHEVIELLIVNLYAGIRHDNNLMTIVEDIDFAERHIVVRTLENTVYPLFHSELIEYMSHIGSFTEVFRTT